MYRFTGSLSRPDTLGRARRSPAARRPEPHDRRAAPPAGSSGRSVPKGESSYPRVHCNAPSSSVVGAGTSVAWPSFWVAQRAHHCGRWHDARRHDCRHGMRPARLRRELAGWTVRRLQTSMATIDMADSASAAAARRFAGGLRRRAAPVATPVALACGSTSSSRQAGRGASAGTTRASDIAGAWAVASRNRVSHTHQLCPLCAAWRCDRCQRLSAPWHLLDYRYDMDGGPTWP